MNEQQLRWDDLRIVGAISETGSLSGAARRLGVSHATVFRRLSDIERRWGVRFFERSRSGYLPTSAGEELAEVAYRIEAEIGRTERRLAGKDLKLSGRIRVTSTDSLFMGLLAPFFADFQIQHKDIRLEVVISNQVLSLSKREADIAIRPSNTPPESLVGRKIGRIQQAVYGQRQRWEGLTLSEAEFADQYWIGPDTHMGDRMLESWMSKQKLNENCHYRLDTMMGIQAAVGQGSGVAVLPCYLGNTDMELQRLTDPLPELDVPLWILTHPDLRRVKRISTFTAFLAEKIHSTLE